MISSPDSANALAVPSTTGPVQSHESRALEACLQTAFQRQVPRTRFVLVVNISTQTVALFERATIQTEDSPYRFVRRHLASTSRFGIGSVKDSNCTPLGLHEIAEKIGAGEPVGTVFKARKPIGMLGQVAENSIVHRIMWLAGLEPGLNQGGNVDTRTRYIYIHGFGDETTLGRPMSHGCIHLAAADLLPLFDLLPSGTLVWISEQ